MTSLARPVFRLLLPAFAILLAGCATAPHSVVEALPAGVNGSVHGGQQPVAGASLQMYAVGTGGDGTSAVPLFSPAVTTTAYGNFSFPSNWQSHCPDPTSLVYLVATGGDPGIGSGGGSNPQLALMAALGACDAITPSSFVSINEITTVAAVYALAPYMTGPAAVASGASDTSSVVNAFGYAAQLANSATGKVSGPGIPAGYSAPTEQIDTIADILANCINSAGGVYNDGSQCGTFFHYTTPSGAAYPTDAISALRNLAVNPTENTSSLYPLVPPTAPYQPSDASEPLDFSLHLLSQTTLALSPMLGYNPPYGDSQADTALLSNTGSNPASIYSIALGGPGASSFIQSNNCPSILQPSVSCNIQVIYTPGSLATTLASLNVYSNASTSPLVSSALTGNTYVSALLVLPPTPLSFAATSVGSASVSQTIKLTSYGPSPGVIAGISLVGANPADFTQTNNCPKTLLAGNGCAITITFTPTASGPRAATLSVTSNSAYSPTVTASGTGTP